MYKTLPRYWRQCHGSLLDQYCETQFVKRLGKCFFFFFLSQCLIVSKSEYTVYIINYVHVFSSVPPRILWISPSQTAELGKEVTLVCTVTGRPTPRVVWKKNGIVLQDSVSTGNITLVNISSVDGGSYECSAINIVANDTRMKQLNVIGWYFASLDITYRTLSYILLNLVQLNLSAYPPWPCSKHVNYKTWGDVLFPQDSRGTPPSVPTSLLM